MTLTHKSRKSCPFNFRFQCRYCQSLSLQRFFIKNYLIKAFTLKKKKKFCHFISYMIILCDSVSTVGASRFMILEFSLHFVLDLPTGQF